MQKKKQRIIVDTNLWISFLLTKKLAKVDVFFNDNQIELLFSERLLAEFTSVVQRPKFKKYFSLADWHDLMLKIKQYAEFVAVSSEIKLCRDPKDDFLLALAKDGKADFLVTGDKDLLSVGKFNHTQIVSFAEFIAK